MRCPSCVRRCWRSSCSDLTCCPPLPYNGGIERGRTPWTNAKAACFTTMTKHTTTMCVRWIWTRTRWRGFYPATAKRAPLGGPVMNTAPRGNNNAANHIPGPVWAGALIQQKIPFPRGNGIFYAIQKLTTSFWGFSVAWISETYSTGPSP